MRGGRSEGVEGMRPVRGEGIMVSGGRSGSSIQYRCPGISMLIRVTLC